MNLIGKSQKIFRRKNEYYISPLQTVKEENIYNNNLKIPKHFNNYTKTYSQLGQTNYISTTISSKTQKNLTNNCFKNQAHRLPLLINRKDISPFFKMKLYKVALPKHREKKEETPQEVNKRVKNLIEKYALSPGKKNKNDDRKFDFDSYLKLQSRAEIKFRPKFGDSSLELVNYIKKVSSIRKQVLKDILDEIKGVENRFNVEKPQVDSKFRSKDKFLVDNRWKNSFSLEEYQQFFTKNLKGKISSLNYRQMLKKFKEISLLCFSEGGNTFSTIRRLNYID
jgi:hypothetical protein